MKVTESGVLILDDEENILSALKRVFRDAPFNVYCTASIEEGFRILEKEKIKVVVSDHRMPGMSGVDFLKNVKATHPNIIRILFAGCCRS